MKKWLVVINKKWLVSIEADSNGWAENLALNAVAGCANPTAQAFNPETELGTETFRYMADGCETISYGELCNMNNCEVANELEHMNKLVLGFREALLEMQRREKALADAHEWLSVRGCWDGWVDELRGLTEAVNKQNMNLIAIGEEVRNYARKTGCRDELVSEDVIKELRASYRPLRDIKIYG